MQEVVPADGEAVAVPSGDDEREVGAGCFQSGRHCQRPTVEAVESIACHVRGQTRRAADAGDQRYLLLRQFQVGQSSGHGREHCEMPATGAPDGLDAGFVVLGLQGGDGHDGLPVRSVG